MDKLIVTSPAFEDGGLIPVECTGYGADRSPRLELSGLSIDAVSIAIIMDDMGHPIPAFNHWVIWDLPATPVIPESIPHGQVVEALGKAVQGVGYGRHRYRGPKPPFKWSHIYRFNVYVLNSRLDLPPSSRKRALLLAMQGKILQQGVLFGHYR